MRRPRIDLPGIPLHITHRGVNRARVFQDDIDRQSYLIDLGHCARQAGVEIHGYVLMDNHVHLLASAGVSGRIAAMMRALGPRFVGRYNARYGRTGTLWEGRFRSCPVDTENYLLTCLSYIELNPVRAGMVARPENHAWSSVHHHLGIRRDPVLTPHPAFIGLARDSAARSLAWRDVLALGLARSALEAIREHARQERPWGSPAFKHEVAKAVGRDVRMARRGRPPATKRTTD